MGILKDISKEAIGDLPLSKYDGEIKLIDEVEEVEGAFKEILREKVVGVDTETKPAFRKGVFNKTSLIQIATINKVFLFRVHKIGFSSHFINLFENESIEKIGIAFHQDIKELKAEYGTFEAKGIIDLNNWCKKLGFQKIGAKSLSAMVLGIRISKRQRVSNWESSTLSDAQIVYAATDAWICREIYLKIKSELL